MAKQAVVVGDLQVGITRAYPFAAELVPRAATLAATARERGDLVAFVHTALRASGADVSPRNAAVTWKMRSTWNSTLTLVMEHSL